ncbi:ATP-binding protein [Fluviicola sp.]|uniref:sensor histidine kinase n=1 Tax=Fluviicola sp. TaxID=1917219 RepID=UPI00260BCC57|nr:ATP-binding protein [Fluviicola sp.]
MKIQHKLSLLFTVLTATILSVFAGLIYYSADGIREIEFYKRLQREAITKANLFFTAKVESRTLQTIYKNNRETLNEVEVAVYDTDFNLLYHDAADIDVVKETKQMVRDVQKKKILQFYQNDWQVVALLLPFNGKQYIITATAYDQYGFQKLKHMRQTIWTVFVFSVLIIYLTGRFFSKRVLSPVAEIVSKVKNITASNLDLRLPHSGGKDELSALSNTFNEMLDRLEHSFESQKQFVSNISHELRTPLSAIIAELEISANRERSITEYKEVILNALNDAQKLAKLSTSLLDFAKANYDPSEIAFKEIRLDEILLDAMHDIQKQNSHYHIDIRFQSGLENEQDISVYGNEYLLKVAFKNLLENGCKFSKTHRCSVTIEAQKDTVVLQFADEGIGISEEDLPYIFEPFYRGANKTFADGNGIGLSLTKKILQLHHGEIEVSSVVNKGTSYHILFPHM